MSRLLLFSLARKKLFFHKFKTFIIALPVAILIAIIVALAGWVGGLQYTIQKEVLEPIEQQQVLIGVNESSGGSARNDLELKGAWGWDSTDEKLIAKALKIPGITSITPHLSLSYSSNATIDGIDKVFEQYDLWTLDESLAELYGVKDFDYTAGQLIPIIIGENFLRELKLSGKKVSVQEHIFNEPDGMTETIDNSDLLNSSLIGKSGTLSLPLLPPEPQIVNDQIVRNRIVQREEKRLITAEQLAAYRRAIDEVISPYWNINSLKEPALFRFQVVGIDKSGGLSAFIPEDALVSIMQELQNRQQKARTATEIPAELMQEQIYASLIHDNQIRFSSGLMHDIIITANKLEKPTFTIPGLLGKATKDAEGNVTFTEVVDYKITKDSFVNPFLVARISNYSQRERITTELQNIGLFPGSISQFSEYDRLFGILMGALGIGLGVISILVAIVLFILCWGYIADSNQEIGALRAYGLRLGGARRLIAWQLGMILSAGLTIGVLIGIGLMYTLSGAVANFVNTTLLESVGYTELLDGVKFAANDLTHINWQLAGIGTVAALLLPIILSLIASYKRLQLNPVEALKKDA